MLNRAQSFSSQKWMHSLKPKCVLVLQNCGSIRLFPHYTLHSSPPPPLPFSSRTVNDKTIAVMMWACRQREGGGREKKKKKKKKHICHQWQTSATIVVSVDVDDYIGLHLSHSHTKLLTSASTCGSQEYKDSLVGTLVKYQNQKSFSIQMSYFKSSSPKQVSHQVQSEPGVPLCSLQEACNATVGGCHTITY